MKKEYHPPLMRKTVVVLEQGLCTDSRLHFPDKSAADSGARPKE